MIRPSDVYRHVTGTFLYWRTEAWGMDNSYWRRRVNSLSALMATNKTLGNELKEIGR